MSTPSRAAAAPGSALRAWTVPLAWGAGLVSIGMGAAAITGEASSGAARGSGVVLAVAGLLWLAWGAAALSAGRLLLPRTAAASTLVTVFGVAALVVLTGGRASILAAAVAVVLLLAAAVMIIADARRRVAPADAIRTVPLLLAAALVAVVATPALGAVQDAALVRPDGTVMVVDPHAGH